MALTRMVWDHSEGFSSKRPFGNSGWQWELYRALVRSGYLAGEFDEDEELVDVDVSRCRELIFRAIDALNSTEGR